MSNVSEIARQVDNRLSLVDFAHNLITELHGALSEEAAARLHEAADRLEIGPVEPKPDPYEGMTAAELLAKAMEGDHDALVRYAALQDAKVVGGMVVASEATAGR